MIRIDWSKARMLHNLYGHYDFVKMMKQAKKPKSWSQTICKNLSCTKEF